MKQTERLHLALSPTLKAELEREVKRSGASASEITRRALAAYLAAPAAYQLIVPAVATPPATVEA